MLKINVIVNVHVQSDSYQTANRLLLQVVVVVKG